VTLEQNGKVLLGRKFEKVVTDADKEYTGSQVTFLEQAMKVTMADSLRELLKDMMEQTEADAKSWNERTRR
jgi:predicted oxidoreductase